MKFIRYELEASTDSGGAFNGDFLNSEGEPYLFGAIHSLTYVKDGVNPYSNFDLIVRTTALSVILWSEIAISSTRTVFPRADAYNPDGTVAWLISTTSCYVPIVLGFDTVNVDIANGGNTKTGTFYLTLRLDVSPMESLLV